MFCSSTNTSSSTCNNGSIVISSIWQTLYLLVEHALTLRFQHLHSLEFTMKFAFTLCIACAISLSFFSVQANDCIPTEKDSLGPFFIENTPVLSNLNRFNKPGENMRVEGEILSSKKPYPPINGAKVEIWHTDQNGHYYPEDNGDISEYDDDEIDLRGTVVTDAQGKFAFRSVFPAPYEGRPSHIHYRISALGFRTLITQHYPGSTKESPCLSARVDRSGKPAVFKAPIIYLRQK